MHNNSILSIWNSRTITSVHIVCTRPKLDIRLLAYLNWKVFPSWPFQQQWNLHVACWWWPSGSIQCPSNFMLGYRKWHFYLLILTPYGFALCSTMSRFFMYSPNVMPITSWLSLHSVALHSRNPLEYDIHGLLEYCRCWGYLNGSL